MRTTRRKISHLFVKLVLAVLAVEAAITGPKSNESPIRLAKPKSTHSIGSSRMPHQWEIRNPSSKNAAVKLSNEIHSRNSSIQGVQAKVTISEPPDGCYIQGQNFFISIGIDTNNRDSFESVFGESSRICLSLDKGPFHCWPLKNSKILYVGAVDGKHSLVAKLYSEGKLYDETESDVVTFTTVTDPEFEFVEDGRENPSTRQLTEKGDQIESDLDMSKEGTVEVQVPLLQVTSPANRVSYSGESVSISTKLQGLKNQDSYDTFEKYFKKNGFECFNIDMATAYSCFPLFDASMKPLVIGLDTGMHTITAAINNPESGDLLDQSSEGTSTFFMAGVNNSGAVFTAEVNIRGNLYKIPVVMGGCIAEQTKYLCRSIGMEAQAVCLDPVLHHLKMISQQTGFVHNFDSTQIVG